MKSLLTILILAASLARADVVTTSTVNYVAAFTNAQANFAWSPAAVILSFPSSVSPSVTLYRHGNGTNVVLARTSATDTDTLIWVPEAAYTFGQGSSLSASSTVASFTIQLHRRPAP